LLCSFRPRNAFIISGVVIIHCLVFLLFAPPSFEGEKLLASELMMVNLVNPGTHQSRQGKYTPISKPSAVIPTENPNFRLAEDLAVGASGGGVSRSSGLNPRQVLHNPKPNYPLLSRKLREQGMVMIKLCVNQSGFVEEASISKSSGFQSLDKSALTTLSQWRFLPDSSNPNYASQCFQAPIHFSLEG
jgi:protein TonB